MKLARGVRVAIRQGRRQPAFIATIVTTLAVAVGANVAVFSVVNAVVLRALPFASPEQLVWITSVRPDNPAAPFSLPEFMDYREQTRSLSGLAAYANWSASIAGESVTERLQGARMSANSFEVLGVLPVAGRLLQDSDDKADAPQVAVVSYRLWHRWFGGDAGAVGRSVRINGDAFVIAGVLPPHFPLPLRDVDVVTPLVPDRDPSRHVRGSVNLLRLFGRLRPGVSSGQAQQELTSICRSLREQFPVEYVRKEAVRVGALHEVLVGDHRRVLLLLLGAVLVVLGAALANLVALVLVRANERRAELSIRIAIGASRLQLVRQLAVEALLLTLAGTGLGWILGAWTTDAALTLAPPSIPRLGEVSVDSKVLLFAIGLTAVVTVCLSIAPLGAALGARAGDVLRRSSRTAVGDRWGQRVRNALVAGEMSAALILLLATSVLVQNVVRLRRIEPGFIPDAVFQARVSLPSTYRTPDDLARFYERLSERLVHLPGVRDLGSISVAPLSGLLATISFEVPGHVARSERDRPSANARVITPGYFAAVSTRVLRGRGFTELDRSDAPPVALVSSALAERFLAPEPVGRQLLIDDNSKGLRPVEVVGVVEDVRQAALDAPPGLDIYLPLRQIHPENATFFRNNQFWMVRTDTDPAAFRSSFLAQLRAVDPDAGISSTGTMRQYLEASLGPRRFTLLLLAAFSLTAVMLAVTGLYGLVSYTVVQRRWEIGLRMALGATERDVRQLILRQVARLGFAGGAVGLCVFGAVRPLSERVGEVRDVDPVVTIAMMGLLVAVAMVAGWLPARRAVRVEPSIVLKGDYKPL